MSEMTKNEKAKCRLYLLAEDGRWINPQFAEFFIKFVTERYEIEDIGTGNAYNMTDYLLDAIEGYVDTAMVVAVERNSPKPRILFGKDEIELLIEALKDNPNEDAWKVVVELNEYIRNPQE